MALPQSKKLFTKNAKIFISRWAFLYMIVETTMLIVVLAIVFIWILLKFKEMRHKIFSIFLILLILFTYFSFTASLSGRNIDFTTTSGWGEAIGLYFSWLGNAFVNVKSITAYAIGANWNNVNTSGTAQNQTNSSSPANQTNSSFAWGKLK